MTALHPASLFRVPPARRTNRLHPTHVHNERSPTRMRAERPFCTLPRGERLVLHPTSVHNGRSALDPPRRTPVPRATCVQTEVSCATPARRTDRSAYYLRARRTVLFCSPSACGTQCFARRLRTERTALDATCIRTIRS